MTKIVYLFDEVSGLLLDQYPAQESPLEPGTYITPVHSTDVEPPAFDPDVYACRFDGAAWVVAPKPAEPTAPEDLPEAVIERKLAAVRSAREVMLNRLGGIAGRSERAGDSVTAGACDTASLTLLDITKALPTDVAGIESTLTARYVAIVSAAVTTAPSLASTFAGFDL